MSIVSVAVGVHLIIPAEATRIATQADPYVESGTWIWENTTTIDDSDVTVRLEGTPDGTTTEWRMFVSADDIDGDVYDNFVLYEATTALDGQEGTWALFYLIEGTRTRVLDADYAITSETEKELTFVVPETNPNEDARGASVLYAVDGVERLFDWYEPEAGRTHLVGWDSESHVGYVEAWNFNNGERACWGSDLQDTECASV